MSEQTKTPMGFDDWYNDPQQRYFWRINQFSERDLMCTAYQHGKEESAAELASVRAELEEAIVRSAGFAASNGELRAALAERKADGERWQKLTGCARIRVIGYARGGPMGDEGPIRHIGFEFTTDHPDFPGRAAEKSEGVRTLIEFVDSLRGEAE